MVQQYAIPIIGQRPIADITPSDIIDIVQPLWHDKRETATRLLQRMSSVFRSANIRGERVQANPCDGVSQELGRDRPRVSHRAALPWQSVPAFVQDLETRSRVTEASRLALLFLIHTAGRSDEVRGARWCEVNLAANEWTVPAERMKMKLQHVVPLSPAALAIIERARPLRCAGTDLLFPSVSAKKLSDNTLSKLMRDAKVDGTPHGFRTSFKVWASEHAIPDEISEAVLAHGAPNKVRAAYRRTTFLEDRRAVMQLWSDHVTSNL